MEPPPRWPSCAELVSAGSDCIFYLSYWNMIDSKLRRDMQVPSSCKQICLVHLECFPDAELSNLIFFFPSPLWHCVPESEMHQETRFQIPTFGSEVLPFLSIDLSIQSSDLVPPLTTWSRDHVGHMESLPCTSVPQILGSLNSTELLKVIINYSSTLD